MAVPLGTTLWIVRMVVMALTGWFNSCLIVADDIATALRNGDMGPLHVG